MLTTLKLVTGRFNNHFDMQIKIEMPWRTLELTKKA